MKELGKVINKFGCEFTEIQRAGKIRLYSQKTKDSPISHYVVARIVEEKEGFYHGKVIEAGEYFPSLESWGKKAWTFRGFEAAARKFNDLITTA